MSAPVLKPAPDAIANAVSILRRGGLVVMPTETVYGLAADASDPDAVAAIYRVKERPVFNPLIAHAATPEAAFAQGSFSSAARRLAAAFWPGPLTLVVNAIEETTVCDLARAGLDTLALRVPAHPAAHDLLAAFAKSNGKRPRLVHRLDQGTSGVMITARTQPAAAYLSEEFASRRTEKTYLALVRGALPAFNEGTLDTPLVKVAEAGRPRMIAAKPDRKGAQAAVTHWRILTRAGDAALVEARPETGRMHQIRAHLSIAGMPILGDWLYGTGAQGAPRLMLHAAKLNVRHPDGMEMHFEAPLPEDFRQLAEKLGLQSGL